MESRNESPSGGVSPVSPAPGARRFEAQIEGMHCAGCVASIEKSVGAVAGVEEASVNLATGALSVRWGTGRPAAVGPLRNEVARAVAAAGPYRLTVSTHGGDPAEAAAGHIGDESDAEAAARPAGFLASGFLPAGSALALAALTMALAMSPFGASPTGRVVQFLLALPVVLLLGRGFFVALGTALRLRVFGMDSLIGLGAGTAFFASTVQLLAGPARAPLFFDTAALIVAFVLLGRFFEGRARGRASRALDRLLAFAPDRARLLRGDDQRLVPVAEVRVGDRVLVRPGERVPLDGRIVRGGAALDESLITGESLPVERTVSDPAPAGAMNLTGAIEIEVLRETGESTLSRIAQAVRKAQAEKIPLQRAADRVAGIFVPAVMGIGALTVLAWLLAGAGPVFAVERAVAVLVVACPCALGLATPTAVLVATGRSARRGILFRSGAALEELARVRGVALDKTGTLTTGEPEVVGVAPAPGVRRRDLLRTAASAEQGSEHPLGVALVALARKRRIRLRKLSHFKAFPGKGIAATLEDGTAVRVGSERWARELGVEAPPGERRPGASGRLVILRGADWLGSVGFRDRPRAEAAELVERLRKDRLRAAILSGDAPGTVAAVGEELGISRTEGGLLPAEKLEAVDRLQAEYGPVAMVGDGINDAPALARADVGIAFSGGTEIAREAATVTLMRADLRLVSVAVRIARRATRIIRQNLFWAFVYNTAAIPLAAGALYPAAGVLLPPEAAAAAMALSSISVVANSLRLDFGQD